MSADEPGMTATQRVRPRWVWTGLCLGVLGLMVLAAGAIELSWIWALAGVALVLAGWGVSARGGVLSDSRTTRPGRELGEVERGETHRGAPPWARVRAARAQEISRDADETRHQLLDAAGRVGRPNLAPLGSGLVLLTGAWLAVAQWTIYPMSAVSQNNALRDLGVAVVVALAALRVAVAGPRPRAAAVILAGGAALVLFASVMPHQSNPVRLNEAMCGVLVMLGAAMAADTRGLRRTVDDPDRS